MLRTYLRYIGPTRCRLQRQFHRKTLLRPQWPVVAILLDFLIRPGVMARRLLGFHAINVPGRIIATPDRHRIFHHRTNGLEPSVPRMWPLDCGHHLPDVYLAQRCDALITMLDAEFFYDPS